MPPAPSPLTPMASRGAYVVAQLSQSRCGLDHRSGAAGCRRRKLPSRAGVSGRPWGCAPGTRPSLGRRARAAGCAGDGRRRRSCSSSTCGSDERRKVGDLHEQRQGVGAEHGQHRAADGGCLLGTERPLGDGGQLDAEEGVGVLDRLRHRSRDPLLEQGPARCPVQAASRRSGTWPTLPRGRPLPYASNAGPTCWSTAAPLGTDSSNGSSRISVCTVSGWSSASWAATTAPVEWPATWARGTPRWSRSAAASAAWSAMLTGGGVWVLPTQPRLW